MENGITVLAKGLGHQLDHQRVLVRDNDTRPVEQAVQGGLHV